MEGEIEVPQGDTSGRKLLRSLPNPHITEVLGVIPRTYPDYGHARCCQDIHYSFTTLDGSNQAGAKHYGPCCKTHQASDDQGQLSPQGYPVPSAPKCFISGWRFSGYQRLDGKKVCE